MTGDRPDDTGWDAETEREFESEFAEDDLDLSAGAPAQPPDADGQDAEDWDDDVEAEELDDLDDLDDLDAEDEEDDEDAGPGPGPRAAYAINWKTVVAVDAAMGLVVVAAGFVAMVVWNFYLGAALTALGLFYVAMVLRRGRAWLQLRRDAGL